MLRRGARGTATPGGRPGAEESRPGGSRAGPGRDGTRRGRGNPPARHRAAGRGPGGAGRHFRRRGLPVRARGRAAVRPARAPARPAAAGPGPDRRGGLVLLPVLDRDHPVVHRLPGQHRKGRLPRSARPAARPSRPGGRRDRGLLRRRGRRGRRHRRRRLQLPGLAGAGRRAHLSRPRLPAADRPGRGTDAGGGGQPRQPLLPDRHGGHGWLSPKGPAGGLRCRLRRGVAHLHPADLPRRGAGPAGRRELRSGRRGHPGLRPGDRGAAADDGRCWRQRPGRGAPPHRRPRSSSSQVGRGPHPARWAGPSPRAHAASC